MADCFVSGSIQTVDIDVLLGGTVTQRYGTLGAILITNGFKYGGFRSSIFVLVHIPGCKGLHPKNLTVRRSSGPNFGTGTYQHLIISCIPTITQGSTLGRHSDSLMAVPFIELATTDIDQAVVTPPHPRVNHLISTLKDHIYYASICTYSGLGLDATNCIFQPYFPHPILRVSLSMPPASPEPYCRASRRFGRRWDHIIGACLVFPCD